MVFYQIIAWMPPSPYFWPPLQMLFPVSTKFNFLSAAPFQILNLSPQPSRWPRQCSLHQVLNGRDKPESCHICKQLLKPSHWSILLNCFHLSALNHNHSVRGERSVEYFEQRHVDHSGRGVLIYLLWSGLASADCLVLTKVDQTVAFSYQASPRGWEAKNGKGDEKRFWNDSTFRWPKYYLNN